MIANIIIASILGFLVFVAFFSRLYRDESIAEKKRTRIGRLKLAFLLAIVCGAFASKIDTGEECAVDDTMIEMVG